MTMNMSLTPNSLYFLVVLFCFVQVKFPLQYWISKKNAGGVFSPWFGRHSAPGKDANL